jgi:hypothetical protein
VAIACAGAEIATNNLYQDLATQFTLAGLPYTDDKDMLRNAGDHELYVRSLEDFTQAAGNNCPTPLTSANPCGVTTGTWASTDERIVRLYDNYSIWQTPNAAQVTDMIHSRGSLTPGEYMNKLGFHNAEHKIILESTHVPFQSKYKLVSGTLVCFFHTDLTGGQFCSSNDVVNRLLAFHTALCPGVGTRSIWTTNPALPTNNHNFFSAEYGCSGWSPQPGWLVGNTGPSAVQYRWPLLVTDNLACTNGRGRTNVEGVLTRCGADFDAMFGTLVTRPASCAGTVVGACGTQA